MKRTYLLMPILLPLMLAGCGSSSRSASSSIAIGNESPGDNSLIRAGEAPPPIETPKTGALSKEAKVRRATGPPPRKLVIKDLISGTGTEIKVGDRITVNYVAYLYKSGKSFESSFHRHMTYTFTLGSGQESHVIQEAVPGLVGMKVGGRRELIVPSGLGYGETGSPPTIPANEALVYVVDLLRAS